MATLYAVAMSARIGPKKPRQRAYLREWREHRGLTQKQLADRLGTTEPTISRYETGERDYPGKFLAAMAEVIGVPERDLYRKPDAPALPSLDSLIADQPEAIQKLAREIIEGLVNVGTPKKNTG